MEKNRLTELVHYDATTGVFTWKKPTSNRVKVGMPAGTVDSNGYIRLQLDGAPYKAHRLAWLYHYGELPTGEIDHINRITDDNRIENLRCVDRMDNAANNGAKHIGYQAGNGSKPYVLQIRRRGKNLRKAFATMSEAIFFRELVR